MQSWPPSPHLDCSFPCAKTLKRSPGREGGGGGVVYCAERLGKRAEDKRWAKGGKGGAGRGGLDSSPEAGGLITRVHLVALGSFLLSCFALRLLLGPASRGQHSLRDLRYILSRVRSHRGVDMQKARDVLGMSPAIQQHHIDEL